MSDPDPDLTRFEFGGLRWTAEPWIAGALRETLVPHLDGPEAVGAEEVKRTLTRSVHRLELAGRTVFVKHHRPRSLRERAKYLVLRSRAAAEWHTSRALTERGLRVARAVAFGERRVAGVFCEAVLISEAVEGAVKLSTALAERPDLLARAAALIRKLHDADVHHRDLHGGNILVAGDDLVLIDLHRVGLTGRVSNRKRVASIAQFLAALGGRISRADRAAFVRTYLGPDAAQAETDRFVRSAERAVAACRERRYASRTKRCVKKSTGFRRERIHGLRLYRRADFPAEMVLAAIGQHKVKTEKGCGSDVLKNDRRTRVSVVELEDRRCPERLCVKEFIRPGVLQRLGDLVRGSRAKLAWLGSNACAVRGIRTPRRLAMGEAGPRSYLIAGYVTGARRLNDYAAEHGRPESHAAVTRWRAFVRQAADFIRQIHSHRLRHLDLSGKNILVREREGGWEFYLIDVGDIRLGRAAPLRLKIKNLGQLDDVYVKPSRTDRLRFYRHYARGRPEFDRREFLAEIDAHSRARHEHWLESDDARRCRQHQESDRPE